MVKNLSLGTGRRKTSVARVYLRAGSGAININGRGLNEYFPNPIQVFQVMQPLMVTANDTKFDVFVNVAGGGLNGQAGAVSLGLARALVKVDETNQQSLKANGLLTRDSRMVERKKYGRAGARRRFQFSKR